jgi:hypothetical protein
VFLLFVPPSMGSYLAGDRGHGCGRRATNAANVRFYENLLFKKLLTISIN